MGPWRRVGWEWWCDTRHQTCGEGEVMLRVALDGVTIDAVWLPADSPPDAVLAALNALRASVWTYMAEKLADPP